MCDGGPVAGRVGRFLSDAETRRYRGARWAFFPALLLRQAEIGLIIGIESRAISSKCVWITVAASGPPSSRRCYHREEFLKPRLLGQLVARCRGHRLRNRDESHFHFYLGFVRLLIRRIQRYRTRRIHSACKIIPGERVDILTINVKTLSGSISPGGSKEIFRSGCTNYKMSLWYLI